jgi:hypothetical protein
MSEDIPSFLIIPEETRRTSWDTYRASPATRTTDDRAETQRLYEAKVKADNAARMERVRAKGELKRAKKEQALQDRAALAKGKRWNSLRARWEED